MGGGGGELYQYCTSTLIALGLCPSRGRLVNPACLSEIIWRSESCHVIHGGRSLQGWLRDVRTSECVSRASVLILTLTHLRALHQRNFRLACRL